MINPSEDFTWTVDSVGHVYDEVLGLIEISTEGDYNYQWTGPNNFTSNDEDISNLEAGCYTLIISAINTNCTKDTIICIRNTTSIHDPNWYAKDIHLYPNPAESQIFLDVTQNPEILNSSISIFNTNGEKVISTHQIDEKNRLSIDVGHLTPGIYFVQISHDNGMLTKKVLITE